MSRISRYQESMSKFIKNKSIINDIQDETIKNNIFQIVSEFDQVVSILLLTVLNNQSKKNNLTLHGYYAASCVTCTKCIVVLLDNKNKYYKKFGKEMVQKMINELISLLNICLSQNIESIQPHYTKEKLFKISDLCIKTVNKRVSKLLLDKELETDKLIQHTDLVKYHFKDIKEAKKKIASLKQVKQESLDNFIDEKYGATAQIALCLGWILGNGDEKKISNLEKIGLYFSMLEKLTNDFINLDSDIQDFESDQIYTKNYIINYGFQNAFEVFVDNKQKFIEGCILLDIYTNTVKEIIDLIESKVDEIIDRSSPDMRSNYSL